MAELSKKDRSRLEVLLPLTTKVIKNKHLKEFKELHLLIEKENFSTSGCGGCDERKLHSILNKWVSLYGTEEIINKKKENITMNSNNTFKLKKSHPRVLIPGTSKVITNGSSDELVRYYLEQAKNNEAELKRRKSFFEKLPNVKEEVAVEVKKEELKKTSKKANSTK